MVTVHFELTDESMLSFTGERVFRIRAIRDIPERFVKAGDLGGWVSSEYTSTSELRIGPKAWVAGDAVVAGDAQVLGNALVYDSACVFGSARVKGWGRVHGNAKVFDDAIVKGRARVNQAASVFGAAQIGGHALITGTAEVTDNAKVSEHAVVAGDCIIEENAQITGNSHISDSLVTESARIDGHAALYQDSAVSGDAHIYGDARLYSTIASGSAKISGGAHHHCWITDTARVAADLPERAVLTGKALVEKTTDCEVFQPVGILDATITVVRTATGDVSSFMDPDDVAELEKQGLGELFHQQLDAATRRIKEAIHTEPAPDEPLSFELTEETTTLADGTTIYRIRATKNIQGYDFFVPRGELGGWVSSTHTSNHTPRIAESAWLSGDAILTDEAHITAGGYVVGQADISTMLRLEESDFEKTWLKICGTTVIHGGTVYGHGALQGQSWVGPEAVISPVGVITDAHLASRFDHRQFGPTSLGTTFYITRGRNRGVHIMAETLGEWTTGTLDELLPENPIQRLYAQREWVEKYGWWSCMKNTSTHKKHRIIEEYTTLRNHIIAVLKEWDL